jgi:peptidoglycan/xylan/chitin deacetylase (PgdA/CDA1 family)
MSDPIRRPLGFVLVLALLLTACSDPAPSASPPDGTGTPGASAASDSAAPTVNPSATPSGEASPSPSATIAVTVYTVVAGDTLYGIARRFATTVEQLQAWNAGRYPTLAADPATLNAGWQLIVAGEPGVTPLPTPTTAPTASATTPSGTGCHVGNRVAASPAGTYQRVPNAGPQVAITFDMGGRLDPALDILDFLIANHVCTTIFPTGAMSDTTTGQKVLAVIRAHPELFEVGNHTMHHCDLIHGGLGSPTTAPCKTNGRPSADFVRKELTDAAAILAAGTGQQPVPYWRPPYGTYDQTLLNVAAGVGYTRTMLWDIDTIDWKPIADGGPTAQQIASKVVTKAVNGSIVLDHLGGYETLKALQIMVPALRQRGFTLTSISDLFDGA